MGVPPSAGVGPAAPRANPNIIGITATPVGPVVDAMGRDTPDGVRELDVREIDGPPFDHIVAALSDLGRDETLVLISGFEPEPLYDVLDDRGFSYDPTQSEGLWRVAIEHDGA